MKIKKRNGKDELFDSAKLCGSILEVGADSKLAQQVCSIVEGEIKSGASTEEVYVTTKKYLEKRDPRIAALYALEKGLSALGPSGFLFEQYVCKLFQYFGYKAHTNPMMEGEAAIHELDVWAEKGNTVFVVEAKYRNDFKAKTHINQVMYADARLGDIRRQARKKGDNREYYMWVITNTDFTDNAIHYTAFRDVQLLGWSHPSYINLMKIVREHQLYPVTVLSNIDKKSLSILSSRGDILVRDLENFSNDELEKVFSINSEKAVSLSHEIKSLLHK